MQEKTIRKASVLQQWLKHYPEELRSLEIPHVTLTEFLARSNKKHDQVCLEYYGGQFTLTQIFEKANEVAKSLAAMGIKEGDRIPVFVEFQAEFVFLLLGAEKIGAALVCRNGTVEEYVQALKNAKGSVAFVQDFLSEEEEALFYDCCDTLEHIVVLSPYTYAKKDEIPDYVEKEIRARYPEKLASRGATKSWGEFLSGGAAYTGEYIAHENPDRPLYHPYTSGSTAPSKEVIHTAATMIGVLAQLTPMLKLPFSMTAMMCCLPPSLIAVVSPVVLLNIATANKQVLSPYCAISDVDLELMRYQPSSMIAVTIIGETIRTSTRIPEDYPLDRLFIFGGGAEPANNKRQRAFREFLQKHNSPTTYSMGWGQTEAGSAVACTAVEGSDFMDCRCGIPLPKNIVSVFDKDCNELDYASVGELCVRGPGVMVGYGNQKDTDKILKRHADGNVWLHTGDYGYLNDDGEITILGRGQAQRYGGGYLYPLPMENKAVETPGIYDCFFTFVPDEEHEGYVLPYLYVILDEGADLDSIRDGLKENLEAYEYPVEIKVIREREYFHFKTNKRQLVAEALEERKKARQQLSHNNSVATIPELARIIMK